ncbi:MFS transporter [Helicobacter suis]|uniref:MFS transporter n=1 Tax=Helicobacter suis TaxID=104628 RepID=UPI00196832C4|nr:MFS transporter [Helicobacter suis]
MQNLSRAQKIRSLIAAASGNLVEWFDFYIYAFSATYFAHSFSESSSPIVQQIQVFGIFAVGFLMRPLGSWFFGSLADRIGRKKSMILSVCLMAAGSFLIAALPTKEKVGDLAILLLLVARMIQGLSVGGEYGIVATYLSELGSKGKRGFYSSFQHSTIVGGQFLAVASIELVLLVFSAAEVMDFAWRFLFVLGGLLALGSLLARRLMDESSSELEEHADRGTLRGLLPYWNLCLIVFIIAAGGSLAFYTITTYAKTYLENAGMAKPIVNQIFMGGLFILMVIQPLFGIIGDKIGHKNAVLVFTVLAFFGIYPLFKLLPIYVNHPTIVFFIVIALFSILSFYTSVTSIVTASLFPEHVRALGTGFSFALGNALCGGSATYVALQFKNAHIENGFFVYVAVLMVLMFIAAMCLPKKELLD